MNKTSAFWTRELVKLSYEADRSYWTDPTSTSLLRRDDTSGQVDELSGSEREAAERELLDAFPDMREDPHLGRLALGLGVGTAGSLGSAVAGGELSKRLLRKYMATSPDAPGLAAKAVDLLGPKNKMVGRSVAALGSLGSILGGIAIARGGRGLDMAKLPALGED